MLICYVQKSKFDYGVSAIKARWCLLLQRDDKTQIPCSFADDPQTLLHYMRFFWILKVFSMQLHEGLYFTRSNCIGTSRGNPTSGKQVIDSNRTNMKKYMFERLPSELDLSIQSQYV